MELQTFYLHLPGTQLLQQKTRGNYKPKLGALGNKNTFFFSFLFLSFLFSPSLPFPFPLPSSFLSSPLLFLFSPCITRVDLPSHWLCLDRQQLWIKCYTCPFFFYQNLDLLSFLKSMLFHFLYVLGQFPGTQIIAFYNFHQL